MNCIECGKELTKRQSKFCSKKCNNAYYRKHHKKEFKEYKNNWERENMDRRKQEKEEYAQEHGFESLNKLTYLHEKMRNLKPKSDFCPICNEYKKLQLASINHSYTENPKDWIWLCQSCHYLFDNYSGEKEERSLVATQPKAIEPITPNSKPEIVEKVQKYLQEKPEEPNLEEKFTKTVTRDAKGKLWYYQTPKGSGFIEKETTECPECGGFRMGNHFIHENGCKISGIGVQPEPMRNLTELGDRSELYKEKPEEPTDDLVFWKYKDKLYGLPEGYILIKKADLEKPKRHIKDVIDNWSFMDPIVDETYHDLRDKLIRDFEKLEKYLGDEKK